MVSIRLKRFGAKKRPYYRIVVKRPYYRIVVMDNRAARTSETIDEVGTYHPVEAEDRQVTLDKEKVESWIAKGAQPSATVKKILNKQGVSLSRKSQN